MADKAYQFRIYPNEEQKVLFAKTFGCVRFIYNRMLSDKIKHYEETKQKLNNTPAQYKAEFEWLKGVDSLALAHAQMNLQKAYNNFLEVLKSVFPNLNQNAEAKILTLRIIKKVLLRLKATRSNFQKLLL